MKATLTHRCFTARLMDGVNRELAHLRWRRAVFPQLFTVVLMQRTSSSPLARYHCWDIVSAYWRFQPKRTGHTITRWRHFWSLADLLFYLNITFCRSCFFDAMISAWCYGLSRALSIFTRILIPTLLLHSGFFCLLGDYVRTVAVVRDR